jgi:protein-disulfide isomerase
MIKQIQSVGEGAYKDAMTAPSDQRFVKLAEAAGLIKFVQRLGIPQAKAEQCLADGKAADALAQNVKDATAKYTIAGTPTLILNGSVLDNVATWEGLESRLHDAGA